MYEWIPQKTNKTAQKLILLFFAGAAALMLLTIAIQGIPYRWVFQLISLGLLTGAIFLTTRYVTKSFCYRIVLTDSGTRDLTVTELGSGGKRQITVCRVGLSGIRKRVLLDLSDGGASEKIFSNMKKEKRKIFDYCADYRPLKSVLLIVEEGGEELCLRLDYEKALYDLLAPAAGDGDETDEESENG